MSADFKKGVSLVSCCMGRNDSLKISIDTWLNIAGLDEIIIVDWSSTPSVEELIPKKTQGKTIKYIRVENQDRWVLSWAYNLGVDFVSYDRLLKIDCDIIVMPDFLERHRLARKSFQRGFWKKARNDNELHLNGQMQCWTEDFIRLNGYNERITSYGWEDDDLYWRLSSIARENIIDNNYLHHISSNNERRIENQKEFLHLSGEQLGKRLFRETMKNRKIGIRNIWNKKSPRIEWKTQEVKQNFFKCEIKE